MTAYPECQGNGEGDQNEILDRKLSPKPTLTWRTIADKVTGSPLAFTASRGR